MKVNDSELNSMMMTAATSTFDNIIRLIQSSNLNFQLQLSPFTAAISLKKTPVKDRYGTPLLPQIVHSGADVEVSDLVAKNIELENELLKVKEKYAVAKEDSETAREMLNKMKIKPDPCENSELFENKVLVNKLCEENANLVKQNDHLKDIIKDKNDEIRELEMADNGKREALTKLNKELKEVKLKLNKEKTEILKSHKAEVKCWRRELGEERKNNIKLSKKLKDMENFIESKPTTTKKKPTKKNIDSKSDNCKNIEKTFCSICSAEIRCYIPEYFVGEKFNPACERCKANDSSWDPNDPFLSFPSLSQPVSLVSHWLLPYQQNETQNPRSIISLLSHCVKFPNPGDTFISMEEALELLKTMFEEMRKSL